MEQELREMGLSWDVAGKLSEKGSGKVLRPYASLGQKTIEPMIDHGFRRKLRECS